MAGHYERVLGAELVAVMGVETLDALVASGGKSKFSLPDPSIYFATLVVYLMLSGLALFGDKYGRLAAAFGGVAAAGILMAPTARSKAEGTPKPLIMSMITYFDSVISGGTEAAPITSGPNISERLGKAVSGGGAPNAGNPGTPNIVTPTTRPKGAPPGKYGVDPNGGIWKQNSNGSWTIWRQAGQTKPASYA